MYVDETTGSKALEVLQGKVQGDTYEAANQLAARVLVEMNRDEDEGLTDWLYNGDFDGSETIRDLIVEWVESTQC